MKTDYFITTIHRESPLALDELKRWAREEMRLMRSGGLVLADLMMNNCPFALQAGFFIEFITWYNDKQGRRGPIMWGYKERLKADIRMAMRAINTEIINGSMQRPLEGVCKTIDFNSRQS